MAFVADALVLLVLVFDRRLAPGGLVPQFPERCPLGQTQQIVLTARIGIRRVGDGCLLFGRQRARASRSVGLGVSPQAFGVVELLLGLGHRLAALATKHVGGRAVPAHAPQLGLGHPSSSQGLDGGRHVLDARGALHHPFGLGGRYERRIEARGEGTHCLLQLGELLAHVPHRLLPLRQTNGEVPSV